MHIYDVLTTGSKPALQKLSDEISKIVVLEKTTWYHFRLMKTGFLFLLQTIY